MFLTLKKIQHRGADRIGICFPYSIEVNEKLKTLNAVYSSTHRCWYLDYNNANYNLLKKNFDNLVIENPRPEYAKEFMRNRAVKEKAEMALQVNGFFPSDYIEKEQPVKGGTVLIVKPHIEDNQWMQVFVPPVFMLREKIKRFSMSRYSVPHGCYLLPAAPDVYKALTVHYGPEKVVFKNLLPAGYLLKEKLPNQKQFLLQKAKNQVLEKVPETSRGFVVSMMDAMLANNLSDATIKNYGNAFCRFLCDNDYRDPASFEYKQMKNV